jgi:L-iditol 2-dehydrogenase
VAPRSAVVQCPHYCVVMAETMKAGRMLDIGRMVCEEAPIPELTGSQILVKTECASICGSDLHIVMQGAGMTIPESCPHGFPGHEGVGRVVASNDPSVEVGIDVLTFPNTVIAEGFSEYQRLLNGQYCMPLPDCDVPHAQLMMAQQLGTVIFAHNQRLRDVEGETVVVLGQGSAGLFWTWLLKRAGAAQVIVSDRSNTRLAVSTKYGADIAVNSVDTDIRDVVKDMTGGAGADYVVEAVGSSTAHDLSTDVAKMGGGLMWFGLPDTSAGIEMSFARFFRKKLTATSTFGAQDEVGISSFKAAMDYIANGDIDVAPLVTHVYPVDEISTAMDVAFNPVDAAAVKVSVSF